MHSVCVFLGARPGSHPAYAETTKALGRALARRGLRCVYGGSSTGLMLTLADSVLEGGGEIVGVTVQTLKDRENFHPGLTRLHVVPTMHERKNRMIDLADAFVVLPGGIGTFDEFFEVCTLGFLGFHNKPCGLLDVNGYFDPLRLMLERAAETGFMQPEVADRIIVSTDPGDILDLLAAQA